MTGDLASSLETSLRSAPLMAYAVAYLSGLLVSFTPCIYPVVPVTVAYISTQSGGSRLRGFTLSLVYVLGTSFTYTVLGSAAAFSS